MTFKGKRRVSCDDMGWDEEFKKGAWTAEEDTVLRTAVYVSADHIPGFQNTQQHSVDGCFKARLITAMAWRESDHVRPCVLHLRRGRAGRGTGPTSRETSRGGRASRAGCAGAISWTRRSRRSRSATGRTPSSSAAGRCDALSGRDSFHR